jgi:hypothetical protein
MMQTNNTKKSTVILALLTVNIAATIFIALYLFIPAGDKAENQGLLNFNYLENGNYILYIGTNDKETYEQIIPTDEAKRIVNEICAKYVDGYTVSEAQGGWVDEHGILTQENTLIYSFIGAEESDIIAIMNEVLVALNQNSILVEKNDISSIFYNGRN